MAAGDIGIDGARRELLHRVAHLGGFGEHHGGTRAHQQVGAIADGRIRRDAGEGVAAAALHADHQLAGGHRLAAALVQAFQVRNRLLHHGFDDVHEALVLFVLEPHDIEAAAVGGDRDRSGWQQALGLQLLAAQAEHHHLAAEVRVGGDVAQGADRDHRIGRVDGDAAAVAVLQRQHAVDVGVLRQQLGADALGRDARHAGDALHGLRDRQQVARADGAVGVAVALEGVALERLRRGRLARGHRQVGQVARRRHAQQPLVHPAACGNRFGGVADGHVVAPHHAAFGNVDQRHLVPLRHPVAHHQTVLEARARTQPTIVGHDGHVVGRVHLDAVRLGGHGESLTVP